MTTANQQQECIKRTRFSLTNLKYFDWLVVLACLSIAEYVCYISTANKLGLFIDEWELFGRLHFLPHSMMGYIQYILHYDYFTVRPLLAPLLGPLYYFLGEHPLGYHLVNYIFELAGAQFLYLVLTRLTKQRPVAFVASMLFLLYPNHGVTHYFVNHMIAALSLAEYILCVWFLIKGLQENHKWCLFVSYILFSFSIFTYEHCMPFVLLNALISYWIITKQNIDWKRAFKLSIAYLIPYLMVLAGLIFYRKIFLPAIGYTSLYRTGTTPKHFIDVIKQGIEFSIGYPAFNFFWSTSKQFVNAGLKISNIFALLLMAGTSTASIFSLKQNNEQQDNKTIMLTLAGFGLLGLIASYITYAFAADYMPTLNDIYSRVNSAGSLGAAIFIAALLGYCSNAFIKSGHLKRSALLAILSIPIFVIFTLCDLELSKQWLLSSAMQKRISELVLKHSETLLSGSCIILTDTPRYVMAAPLFDSGWDFQSMIRIVLNNNKLNAGVISERMIVNNQTVKDISCGILCGEYPFKQMLLLIPSQDKLVEINSANEFIANVSKYGMDFGLDPQMPNRWQQELVKRKEQK